MYGYLSITILLSTAGLLIFIYFAKKDQFEDSEDVKYQMFRDED